MKHENHSQKKNIKYTRSRVIREQTLVADKRCQSFTGKFSKPHVKRVHMATREQTLS